MSPDERDLLTRFLADMSNIRTVQKDAEADELIRRTLSSSPDAGYLLVQHAIVADRSLQVAQARIAELEAQTRGPTPPAPSSFLPEGAVPWDRDPRSPSAVAMQDYRPGSAEQRPSFFSTNSGLGSFLRNAGTTAAGVAGGEALFSGLSDIFGGHRGGPFVAAPEEVVVNNYGDDSEFYDPDS